MTTRAIKKNYYGMRYIRDENGRATERDLFTFGAKAERSSWIDACPAGESRHEWAARLVSCATKAKAERF